MDRPAFGWRGLLVDVCRHWISPAALHRTIDAMALARLDVLHLHLSDDQAHRLESRAWPRLHTVAPDGRFLTHDDVASLVQHGARAGVRIVPELDMPGHTTAWLAAYPHLATRDTDAPTEARRTMGIAEVAIDPEAESTFEFLAALFDEVVDQFPDPYLHLGGDEVAAAAWPGRDVAATQAAFTDRVVAMAFDRRRTPVVWDEAWHPRLDRRVVVQVWRGHGRLRAAASEGRPVLLSTPYYLDLSYHPRHHRVVPSATAAQWRTARERLWADPALGALAPLVQGSEQAWELGVADPPDVVSPADRPNVLGGEACLWTELCPEELLDLRLWPTAVAVADVLWSGDTPASPEDDPDGGTDGDRALLERLDAFEHDLLTVGIDLDARRRERWVALADGDTDVADDLDVLARSCVPVAWYGRHALLADQRIDVDFDRFVDTLRPWARGTADDPEVRSAAARLVERLAHAEEPRLAEVREIARRLLDGGEATRTVGDVVIVRP